MAQERAIIHLNVADFAVAVERAGDVRLQERPLIIAAQGSARSRVYDMSEEAYREGVRKNMSLDRALRLVPKTQVLPPHPERYEQAMRDFLQRTLPYSPLIESDAGYGHLFLDVTGTGKLFGVPPDVAWKIRKTVRNDLGLDPIWSVAPNKLIAKVATRVVKPTGEYIIEAGEEMEFLGPLPVHLLPGIEENELRLLDELHLRRIKEVTALSLFQLEEVLGRRAQSLYDLVHGIDLSPVLPVGRQQPSIIENHHFPEDTNEIQQLENALYFLVERAACELRRRHLAAYRIGVLLDYSDGVRIIRQATSQSPTSNDFRLFTLGKTALHRASFRRLRVRHLRLFVDRLVYPPAQMDLFMFEEKKRQTEKKLIETIDAIRNRYGSDAIRFAREQAA